MAYENVGQRHDGNDDNHFLSGAVRIEASAINQRLVARRSCDPPATASEFRPTSAWHGARTQQSMNQTHDAPPLLMDQVRDACRLRHLSPRTEEAYCHWIRGFIVFSGTRHPSTLGSPDIEHFLSSLATDLHVSASTQNQALCALLFLYRNVLRLDLSAVANVTRVRTPARLPEVMNRSEVRAVMGHLSGVMRSRGSIQLPRESGRGRSYSPQDASAEIRGGARPHCLW